MSVSERGNYAFLLSKLEAVAPRPLRILDFGCGKGDGIRLGLRAGFEMSGCDCYAGTWHEATRPDDGDVLARIATYRPGEALPFPAEAFDAVISNMVFEHIPDPKFYLEEIHRILKPGGVFVAAFQSRDSWFEGHVRLYFVHRLAAFPAMQRAVIEACFRLGLGSGGRSADPRSAAQVAAEMLRTECFNHREKDLMRAWRAVFRQAPSRLEADLGQYRLGALRAASRVPAWLTRFLGWGVVRTRLGCVFATTRPV